MLARHFAVEARKSVSKDETEKALNILLSYIDQVEGRFGNDKEWQNLKNRIILKSGDFNRLKNNKFSSLSSTEQNRITQNQINNSILAFAIQIEELENDYDLEFSHSPNQEEISIENLIAVIEKHISSKSETISESYKVLLHLLSINKSTDQNPFRDIELEKVINILKKQNREARYCRIASHWISEFGEKFGLKSFQKICDEPFNQYICGREDIKKDVIKCIKVIILYSEHYFSVSITPDPIEIIQDLAERNVIKGDYYEILGKIFKKFTSLLEDKLRNDEWEYPEPVFQLLVNYFESYHDYLLSN